MPGSSSFSRSFILITLAATCAVAVLLLAWPRLHASLLYLPVDTALSKYRETRQIAPAQVDALVGRAQNALVKYDHYRYWEGLSELQILASQDMTRPYWQRRNLLEQVVLSAQEAVRRAPARPRIWLRMARARAALGQPGEQVIRAWKMSVLTGRVEPTLMLVRMELAYRYLAALDNETLDLLRDQTALTWAVHKKQFANSMEGGSLDPDLVRKVLAGTHQEIINEMGADE